MSRPISLAHLTVIELSPPEVIAVAHEAGYDSVDLRLAKAIPQDVEYPVFGDTPMRREILARMADTGVKVFDVEIIRLRRGIEIDKYLPLFEAAGRLGARRVKIAGDEPDEAFITETFAAIADAAKPFGLTADLEFMAFAGIRTLEQAVRIVEGTGRGNANVLIDSLHLSRSGGTPQDVEEVDPALFGYVQLCDAPAALPADLTAIAHEARTERLIPGDGDLPLAELVARMPSDIPVSLELPMKELARRMSALNRAKLAIAGARKVLARAQSLELI